MRLTIAGLLSLVVFGLAGPLAAFAAPNAGALAPGTAVRLKLSQSAVDRRGASQAPRIRAHYAALPLQFEPNQGQTAGSVRYIARGRGYTLFLNGNDTVVRLHSAVQVSPTRAPHPRLRLESATVRMALVGANPHPIVQSLKMLPGHSSYYLGKDPAKWRTDVAHYGVVRSKNVYPGVDLVYYGNQQQLEYDFVASPGADLRGVRFKLQPDSSPSQNGSHRFHLNAAGDLVSSTPLGEVRWRRPVAYQDLDGRRSPVACRYLLEPGKGPDNHHTGAGLVRFQLGAYDHTKTLVIDPILAYSTLLSGSGADEGFNIAVDSGGSVYVVGATASTDFPTLNPAQTKSGGNYDVFVSRLTPDGSGLVYSTYLGGSQNDYGYGVAIDSKGAAYVTGYTQSQDFPVTPGAFQTGSAGGDGFVTKLNGNGGLVYSTYLGGIGDDSGSGVAVDSQGDAYVVGSTLSDTFPTTPGAFSRTRAGGYDMFVTELDPAGATLVFSTYLGGTGDDFGTDITLGPTGSVYVTGYTISSDFPTTAGAFQLVRSGSYDAAVVKMAPTGASLQYSTLLGGAGNDRAFSIAVDANDSAYVTGFTQGGFPTTTGAFQTTFGGVYDAFVTKLKPDGSAPVYSTYLGGADDDSGNGIAVDSQGYAYVTGYTHGNQFPVVAGAFQAASGGGYDAFVSRFNPTGSGLFYSSYLGGPSDDNGNAIAVLPSGTAYITGMAGPSFPTTPGAFQTVSAGAGDAFVAKITAAPPIIIGFSPTSGYVGTVVTISGMNFTGATSVQFNGVSASFTVDSDVQITATVPLGATTGAITVTSPSGTGVSKNVFTVLPPNITGFNPTMGPVGTVVTITGAGFSGASSVTFNGVAASYTVNSDTQITATVPLGASTGPISVTAPPGTGTSSSNFVVPPPANITFSPASGPVDTAVTIMGTGFAGVNAVKFNGLSANFTYVSPTQINATVPLGASTGPISVTTPAGTGTSAANFVVPAPVITSFNPGTGPVGTLVTITGTGFAGTTSVTFNGVNANYTINSPTQITATVPLGAHTGPIQVTTPAGVGVSSTNFVVREPMITSFSPTSGSVGTTVTILGSDLSNATTVAFNGVPGYIYTNTDIEITVSVPVGASSGPISVTNADGTGVSATNFTVPSPAGITFSPASGMVGSSVTITGTDFLGATGVKFNGTTANYDVDSSTQITAFVPYTATSGPIQVITPAGSGTSAASFTVLPAIVTSFSPKSGGVGTIVTLTGNGLANVNTVQFNGVNANFVLDSNTQIRAFVPEGASSGPITVSGGAGSTTTSDSFMVVTPTVTGFAPGTGPVGLLVTINGTDFLGATKVQFAGVAASYIVDSATQIRAYVPVGAGDGPISVITPAGTGTSAANFIVTPPSITGFSPASGSVGASVVITGANFTGATSVAFNGTSASYRVDSDTQITATVPQGATSGVLTVTTPAGSASSANQFFVVPPK